MRVCGGGGEGGVRGAKLGLGRRRRLAGHPGRRRCAPGRATAARVGAGGGARCTVTGSCAPRPRGDIHWPAGPGSASAPREAQVSAAQGSRAAPRFAPPSYLGGRWETAEGELRVDGGFAPVASSVPGLGKPQKSRRSRRCCGSGAVRWEGWGSRTHKPSPAGVLERVKRQGSRRGAVLLRQPQKKKVWLSASSSRSPAESDCGGGGGGGGRQHRRRWPRGFLARAVRGRAWVCGGERRAEVTNQPAGRSRDA